MMSTQVFIGRKNELACLKDLHKKKTPNLVVVKGRRRVGKSRLIHFFASSCQGNRFWDFAGLAPQEGIDDQSQRDHFARQLATHLKLPPFTFQDWTDAFEHLHHHIKSGDIILFDEISWMAFQDPSFIPKLKAWWALSISTYNRKAAQCDYRWRISRSSLKPISLSSRSCIASLILICVSI